MDLEVRRLHGEVIQCPHSKGERERFLMNLRIRRLYDEGPKCCSAFGTTYTCTGYSF